jgi:hypothetical protein
MNMVVQALCHLVVDLRAESRQAPKGRLDVSAGATEPVIEVEMPEGSIEIVAPHQADDAAAEPDAFRIAGGAVEGLRRFNEFVGFVLAVRSVGRVTRGRLAGLIRGGRPAALGSRAAGTDQECKPGNGEETQNRILKLKHTSTHEFPDIFLAAGQRGRTGLMRFK